MLGFVRTAFITLGTTLVELYCQVLLIVNDCLELWQKIFVAEDGSETKGVSLVGAVYHRGGVGMGVRGLLMSLPWKQENELYWTTQQLPRIPKPSSAPMCVFVSLLRTFPHAHVTVVVPRASPSSGLVMFPCPMWEWWSFCLWMLAYVWHSNPTHVLLTPVSLILTPLLRNCTSLF